MKAGPSVLFSSSGERQGLVGFCNSNDDNIHVILHFISYNS